ncbi:MAG: group III truncated hemoglobin [Chitinophagaceae bacterium]
MPKDIENKEDLVTLVNRFYTDIRQDELLGPIFNSIIGDDWSKHLPIMYTFWNSVLFGAESYKGQAIGKHIEIDRKIRLEPAHFERWIALWNKKVDELFEGKNAELIKVKAATILQLIQFKVEYSRSGKLLI